MDEFKGVSVNLFPLSTAMKSDQELETLRIELAGATKKAEEAKPVVDADE